MKLRETLNVNADGQLVIGGIEAKKLAEKFGTPLYVMDAAHIEQTAAAFNRVLKSEYPDSRICYASKAFACKAMYQLLQNLGLGADVAGGGELYTAMKAGMNPDDLYFHGNNKSAHELTMAVSSGVHAVVVDSLFEIELLDGICAVQKKKQRVLIRVNPGVEAHTHHFVQTARPDSKFGFGVADGAALAAVKQILSKENLDFAGIHCHIGSQIFETESFVMAVDKMTDFITALKNALSVTVKELNMGGGYGVTYTAEDKPLAPSEYAAAIVNALKKNIAEKNITAPRLIIEPGRALAAEAGITLYTVGAVKEIAGIRKYVSVDGGLFENPRYTMYQAKYEPVLANKASLEKTETVTVAGKCCESDLLIVDAKLPPAEPGDILAVLGTGAYNYSMAGNYNRNPVPPVIMVKDGNAEYIVTPQTYKDIMAHDADLPKFLRSAEKN